MTRRLLNFLTVGSLLLCVAVVALWVRSHWRSDWITHRSMIRYEAQSTEDDPQPVFVVRAEALQLWTGSGNIRVSWSTDGWEDPSDDWREATRTPPGLSWSSDKVEDPAPVAETRTAWNRLGFESHDDLANGIYQRSSTTACVPLWSPAAVFVVLPALRARRLIARRAGAGYPWP
jgi:hypothetical protein